MVYAVLLKGHSVLVHCLVPLVIRLDAAAQIAPVFAFHRVNSFSARLEFSGRDTARVIVESDKPFFCARLALSGHE